MLNFHQLLNQFIKSHILTSNWNKTWINHTEYKNTEIKWNFLQLRNVKNKHIKQTNTTKKIKN